MSVRGCPGHPRVDVADQPLIPFEVTFCKTDHPLMTAQIVMPIAISAVNVALKSSMYPVIVVSAVPTARHGVTKATDARVRNRNFLLFLIFICFMGNSPKGRMPICRVEIQHFFIFVSGGWGDWAVYNGPLATRIDALKRHMTAFSRQRRARLRLRAARLGALDSPQSCLWFV